MAGSGVGKSTLLSGICQHVNADINIVALIGERGREVEEFVHRIMEEKSLERTIVIAATAQESPIIRAQAAQTAIVLAEYFADQGKDVFFTMDSVTRFATALRDIGLAAGEPPTVKGYTPSVFSAVPDLIERCGNFVGKGSISAIFTVLVEGDDFNDPVVDTVRAILDGHIVLSRELAEQGHYPAIDIAKSLSRLFNQLNEKSHAADCRILRKIFNDYQQNKDILELGLFEQDDTKDRDHLIQQWKALQTLLIQDVSEKSSHATVVEQISSFSKDVA
jgi:flagellum-specific ATP synthase